MFGHDYYYGSIRKYVALFGTLFNDIHVIRDNTSRNLKQTIKVPVTYGPREKVLARLTQDPDLNRMPAITLPRMSFEITNVSYAASRKLNTVGRRVAQNQDYPSKLNYAYNPVPYDIAFTLSIIVKNADDGAQIVEQILPFFTPEWTTTVELIPELNAVYDIPLVLNDVRSEDNYDGGDFLANRTLIWTLSFTMKAYFFGPVRKTNIIKFANTNVFSTLTATTPDLTIRHEPGLTANGQPTSNASLSVDATYIYPDDDYGYITTITDNE